MMSKTKIMTCLLALCGGLMASIGMAEKSFAAGNYKDALIAYQDVIEQGQEPAACVADIFPNVLNCMRKLGCREKWDGFAETALRTYNNDWRISLAVSSAFHSVVHYGFMADGKFSRGNSIHSGTWMNVQKRDRAYCLKLLSNAMERMKEDRTTTQREKQRYFKTMLDWLNSGFRWKLQALTNIQDKPDWKLGAGDDNDFSAAPVDEKGNPLFFVMPSSWKEAKSDGERMRWCLAQLANNGMADEANMMYADFLHEQLGVSTISYVLNDQQAVGMLTTLETLKETESLARLATGIKRFDLPGEHNYIKLYQGISRNNVIRYPESRFKLGNIFSERRQYEKAAKYYSEAGTYNGAHLRLKAITEEWCELQQKTAMSVGQVASVELRYRNAKQVVFRGWKLDVPAMHESMKKGILQGERRHISFGDPASFVMQSDKGDELPEEKWRFLAGKAIEWQADLSPKKGHFDSYSEIALPFTKAGIYLVEAKVGQHVSRRCYIIEGAKIVSKQLNGEYHWQLLRSLDGQALAGKTLDILAWFWEWNYKSKKNIVHQKQFTLVSDQDGNVFLPEEALSEENGWQFVVDANCGELGWALFDSYMSAYRREKVKALDYLRQYAVTDRPVYHPGDTVHFKLWMTDAKYGDESHNSYASGKSVNFVLYSPDSKEILKQVIKTDGYGTIETSWVIPKDAKLGRYSYGQEYGSAEFRVEEYRKPEYEVIIDAPKEPIALGDAAKLTVKAKYYFGMPVADAEVVVKVERTKHNSEWWPVMPWDWFYGKGYAWLWENCTWYPGWKKWGCLRPVPFWWHRPYSAPELICNLKGHLSEDGTFIVPLDTSAAKMLLPDSDHSYSITAEVRDKSRRTIVGTTRVIAARKPFEVKILPDKGFYVPGERIHARCFARTLDGRNVDGNAVVRFYGITYDEYGNPKEKQLLEEKLRFVDGTASVDFVGKKAGQYRISCELKDAQKHRVEGAILLFVRGATELENANCRWNDLELLPEKAEYKPGETLRLSVNTAQKNSLVMLFTRAESGICQRPVILRLTNGTQIYETPIIASDMPNIYFEAYTVSNGTVHNVSREVYVPPVKRVLNVEVAPKKDNVEPGSKNGIDVRVTDAEGTPVAGNLTLSVYDRSVDAIAPNCIPGDIREVFWKWRRQHHPGVNTKQWWCALRYLKGEETMPNLGRFEYLLSRMENGETEELGEVKRGRKDKMMAMGAEVGAVANAPMLMKAAAKPAPAAAEAAMASDSMMSLNDAGALLEEQEKIPVRNNFADTALWLGQVNTDADGRASMDINMPDSLTAWKVQAWAVSEKSAVGSGTAEIITSKDLMVRLEPPRFMVEKDEVIISALVNSKLKQEAKVSVSLELLGDNVELLGGAMRQVNVKSGADARADWRLHVNRSGEIALRVTAKQLGNASLGDSMEMTIPIFIHGTEKLLSFPGSIKNEDKIWTKDFEIPEQIRTGSASLTVNWSPSLAMAMTDALPYLIGFEYECTEQTLNRFLPAVVVRKTLEKMGMTLREVAMHSANLNAQQLGDARERKANNNSRYNEKAVLEDAELNKVISKSVEHLFEMQCADGGWGWFSGYGEHSWPHTTVQVVSGLLLAKEYGQAINEGALKRGINWLVDYQKKQLQALTNTNSEYYHKTKTDAMDAFVYTTLLKCGKKNAEMCELLWRDKNDLPIMGKLLLAEALQMQNDSRLGDIMQNISQFAVYDDENQTTYLKTGEYWWCWYADENEAMARWLSLLVRIGQDKETPPRLVKYLLNNRKYAGRWRSTRDTAACLEAFAEYIQATGENRPDMLIEVKLDDKVLVQRQITKDNLFDGELSVSVPQLSPGKHNLVISKVGTGVLYLNAYAKYFSQEDMIKAEGLELRVKRNVSRVKAETAQALGLNGRGNVANKAVLQENKELLKNGDAIHSGDLLEVELLIDSKNDYEYVLLEDKFAAGTEPIVQQSGYDVESGAYMEYRVGKVAAFKRSVPRGRSVLKYRLRAENPGKFSVLPTTIAGMYAPELYGNADEMKLTVEE